MRRLKQLGDVEVMSPCDEARGSNRVLCYVMGVCQSREYSRFQTNPPTIAQSSTPPATQPTMSAAADALERRNNQVWDAIDARNFKRALDLCNTRIKRGEKADSLDVRLLPFDQSFHPTRTSHQLTSISNRLSNATPFISSHAWPEHLKLTSLPTPNAVPWPEPSPLARTQSPIRTLFNCFSGSTR